MGVKRCERVDEGFLEAKKWERKVKVEEDVVKVEWEDEK